MRREGAYAMVALLVAGGCANVLDLESRQFDAGSETPNLGADGGTSGASSGTSGVATSSSSTTSSSGSADAGEDADSFTACSSGDIIYEHTKDSGEQTIFRYTTSAAAIDDFGAGTALFRAMPEGSAQAVVALNSLTDGTDWLVSPKLAEGSYAPIGKALGYGYVKNWPGTVEIRRWVHDQAAPTRHKLVASDAGTGNWTAEPLAFIVCPL